ncbi:phage terminase large subunit family protein [Xanthobacter versatilis]|uniref:phage terminase large subunit family protein n=1 Tax=Xanthobacter autotrophicus (strain ATCC BAA-1158 / Py2) TaxID=78245 RepID=UPI00372BF9F3
MGDLRARALAALRPPARIDLADWVQEHVFLPASLAAHPGRVRLWPHQIELARSIGDPDVERVSVLKAARTGYSTLLVGAMAHHTANDPCPVLVTVPVDDDARTLMVQSIEPTFAESPALRGALGDGGRRQTLYARRFPGGSLTLVSARSPRNLRGRTARVYFADEVDGYEPTQEGDALDLAMRRTQTFSNRKIVAGSTPTRASTSRITRLYAQSDRRVYECPCPSCGAFHELRWGDITWAPEHPETAAWACPSCGVLATEDDKPGMVVAGRWRPTAPHVVGHHGYRLSALISLLPNAAWPVLVAEYEEAKKDPASLMAWTNTVLGEPWDDEGEEVGDATLAARAEPIGLDCLPADALYLTAGIDTQRDRLECTILGHAREGHTFILAHHVLWGDPEQDPVWMELDALLRTRWKHPLGGSLGIDAAAIDAGDGALMNRVCSFAAPRASRRVVAIKGAAGTRPPIVPSKAQVPGGKLWIVGVDGLKDSLFARLARGASIRFSDQLDAAWFEQLCSERRAVRYRRGQPTVRFERIPGRRAEALDCTVYAIAARYLLSPNWQGREDELRTGAPTAPRQARVIPPVFPRR